MMTSSSENNSKPALALLWAARVLGTMSILFLLFMIFGHIFGTEPQHLNGFSDIVALTFFPTGLLLGLILALKWPKIGGTIAFASMCIFFLLEPDTVSSPWFLGLFAPAVFFFAYGWWQHFRGKASR